MVSMGARQRDNDFQRYYLYKVEKGKNKRSAEFSAFQHYLKKFGF